MRYRPLTVGGLRYTYSMNTNKMTFCNTSLPFNALAVTDVRVGDVIRFAHDGTGRHTVLAVSKGYGQRVVLTTDQGVRNCTSAGTVRIMDVPGYDYHAGHGCIKDV